MLTFFLCLLLAVYAVGLIIMARFVLFWDGTDLKNPWSWTFVILWPFTIAYLILTDDANWD